MKQSTAFITLFIIATLSFFLSGGFSILLTPVLFLPYLIAIDKSGNNNYWSHIVTASFFVIHVIISSFIIFNQPKNSDMWGILPVMIALFFLFVHFCSAVSCAIVVQLYYGTLSKSPVVKVKDKDFRGYEVYLALISCLILVVGACVLLYLAIFGFHYVRSYSGWQSVRDFQTYSIATISVLLQYASFFYLRHISLVKLSGLGIFKRLSLYATLGFSTLMYVIILLT